MAISFKKEVIAEAIKEVLQEAKAYKLTSPDGSTTTQSFADDTEAREFKAKNVNVKDVEALEEDDHLNLNDESDMAKSQLYSTAKYAIELMRMIEDGEPLDAWVQSKLTIAFDYIDSVKHYLEGEEYLTSTEAPSEEEPLAEVEDEDVDVSGLDAGFEDDAANAPKGDKKLNKQLSKNDKIIAAFNELKPLFKKAAAGDKEALGTLKTNQHVVLAYKKLKQI